MKRFRELVTLIALLGLTLLAAEQRVLFEQDDPVGDDYGPGYYVYPQADVFTKGAFDIIHVAIVVEDFDLVVKVQIAGQLLNPWGAPHGFSVQMIDFYLDTAPGGSRETIFDTTIPSNLKNNPYGTVNALIAEDAAWEFAFRIHGWVGDLFVPMEMQTLVTQKLNMTLYATDVLFHLSPAPGAAWRYAKYENVAKVKVDPKKKMISFAIPLHLIGEPSPEWRFVLYMTGVDWGNARVVQARRGDWTFGGGEDNASDPNIVDMLGPQEEILNFKKLGSPVVLPGLPLAAASISAPLVPQQARYLTPEEYSVLDTMFRVHMNYFLSPEAITYFGFPLTAYKVGARGRFGYSNPTEWGYAWQAWIAAAERGIIPEEQAVCWLLRALSTLEALQLDPEGSYQGFPYPFYKMTTPSGEDLCAPYRDPTNSAIPSGDNALLYASLVIVEGWARKHGDSAPWGQLWRQAERVRKRMNFRIFLQEEGTCLYLAHTFTVEAERGGLSSTRWEIFADEGGVVTWIAYLSDSVTFDEYQVLTRCQLRQPATWVSCRGERYTVKEAAWFNAMFTWGVRSLAGFPIGSFDAPEGVRSLYSQESLVPAVQAHLAYGDCLGVDHPGFSDAMSQAENGRGLVGWLQGWFIPPNLLGIAGAVPRHVVPHALFIPFNALPDLPSDVKVRLIKEIVELKEDKAGYYHDSGLHPFGFEVLASPYKDATNYAGGDEGRNIFETLSHAYIVLSLFNALQLNDGAPTFCSLAAEVPGYIEKLSQVLHFLYP